MQYIEGKNRHQIQLFSQSLDNAIDADNEVRYRQQATPVYMQISLLSIVLHLSEHHGDSTPGARIFIDEFLHLVAFYKGLLDKNYTFNRPGICTLFFDPMALEVTVNDPFGNRLTFVERNVNL
ncbi:MAG TPA: glyoxalase superfamily protein [Flavisolibacter sp.]|nr:glyoxalase superfamily protein [Flavisolibacter sp.]